MGLSSHEIVSPLPRQDVAFPRLKILPSLAPIEVLPSVVNSEPKKLTDDEVVEMALNVPYDLTPKHPINTPAGTWHMYEDEKKILNDRLTIFDFGEHLPPQGSYPHVDDINNLVINTLIGEDGTMAQPTSTLPARRPLSGLRRTATAVGMALLGGM